MFTLEYPRGATLLCHLLILELTQDTETSVDDIATQ